MAEFVPAYKPFESQEEDLQELHRGGYVALLNVEMGYGKTPLATWAIERSGAKRVLIVAPDPTHNSAWIPTIRDLLNLEARPIGNTGKARKEALNDFELGLDGVYLASTQFLTRAGNELWDGDMVIVDESHTLSKHGSKGAKKLIALHDRFPMRLALSGTAWRNSFERSWVTMQFLWKSTHYLRGQVAYSNAFLYFRDRMTYEEVYTNQRNPDGTPKTVKKWLNEAEPGLLVSQMPCVIIHKRRERCCEHHPNGFLTMEKPNVHKHTIQLTAKQKKAIKDLEEYMLAFLEENPLVVDLPITQKQRIRQVVLGEPTIREFETTDEFGETQTKQTLEFEENCKSPMIDAMLEKLEELDDEPVLIFLESQRFAEVLVKRLEAAGVSAFEFSGKTKKVRDENLREFGRGKKYRVCVGVLSAISTGVDSIQRATRTEFWAESSVDLTVNIQAQGRAERTGSIGQVDRHYFVDETGYAEGRMSEQLAKQVALAATLRKA